MIRHSVYSVSSGDYTLRVLAHCRHIASGDSSSLTPLMRVLLSQSASSFAAQSSGTLHNWAQTQIHNPRPGLHYGVPTRRAGLQLTTPMRRERERGRRIKMQRNRSKNQWTNKFKRKESAIQALFTIYCPSVSKDTAVSNVRLHKWWNTVFVNLFTTCISAMFLATTQGFSLLLPTFVALLCSSPTPHCFISTQRFICCCRITPHGVALLTILCLLHWSSLSSPTVKHYLTRQKF